jgi:integrase
MLVWLAMTTGARRGELCALRWNWLDLDNATLRIQTSIGQDGAETWEKDTKTHQRFPDHSRPGNRWLASRLPAALRR